jgi:hypothetical protein
MATASEIVADPRLDIDPITAQTATLAGYTDDELAHFRIGHDDINKLVLQVYSYKGPANTRNTKQRRMLRSDVRHRNITDAVFEDSIDKTPTFTLVIHDPEWELLNSGALQLVIDLNPGKLKNRWYRLTAIDVADDDITLTFSTRNAVYLTYHKKPRKANRKRMTRAEFIKSLVGSVKITRIKMYSPQLHDKQRIGKTKFPTDTERKNKHGKGFTNSDSIKVNGQNSSRPQRIVIEKIIQAGLDMHAPDPVIVSAIMVTIQESNASENPYDPVAVHKAKFKGAFQQAAQYGWPATGDAYKDAKGYYAKAIPYWKSHGPMDLGQLGATIQGVVGSSNPQNFGYVGSANSHRDEAQHALHAFTGVEVDIPDTGGADTTYYKQKYEYMVGRPDGPKHENYLAAIYRLAEDVHWSAFWVKDVLHYISEEDLFKAKAHKALKRFDDGVEHVSFEWNKDKRINEMTLQARMERWVCPVGTVVRFDEGGPAEGRWLVTNIRRSMFDQLGEITLSKPMREKVEPANEPGSRQSNTSGSVPTSFTDPTGGELLTIETINPKWTPMQLIDHVIPAYANYFKMTTSLNPSMILTQNKGHANNVSGTTNQSWHKGYLTGGIYQYAADIGNGSQTPNAQMDDLASALIQAFNLPSLANPNATAGDIKGNIVNAYHRGYQFQLIYRTNLSQGGNHYNHVHFGAKATGPLTAPPILLPQ